MGVLSSSSEQHQPKEDELADDDCSYRNWLHCLPGPAEQFCASWNGTDAQMVLSAGFWCRIMILDGHRRGGSFVAPYPSGHDDDEGPPVRRRDTSRKVEVRISSRRNEMIGVPSILQREPRPGIGFKPWIVLVPGGGVEPLSVPGHPLCCGPETSATSPSRRRWFDLRDMRRHISSSRGRGNVGRVESRHHGFPPFPYSVISMACFFRPALLDKPLRHPAL